MVSEAKREAAPQQNRHDWLAIWEASPGLGLSVATRLRALYRDCQPATSLSPVRGSGRDSDLTDGSECEDSGSRREMSLAGSYSAGLPARGYDWFQWRPSIRRQPVRMYPER